jgi:RPA family protein
MSESEDGGGPGTREVAYRLFAAEYEDADLEFSESDEERAPNYVVTPTGARVNRLFAMGVLTEIEQVNEDVLRARVVDPTGAFVVYAGQYQPDEMAALEQMNPPAFVAVTGKANAFQPEDSDRVFTSIRPESINRVDDETRDRWVVATAERTFERLGTFADALELDETGGDLEDALLARGVDPALAQGIAIARDRYGTGREYLGELWDVAVDATRVVAGEIDADEVGPLSLAPGEGGDETDVEFTVSQVEKAETAETATGEVAEPDAEPAEAEPAETEAEATEPAEADTAAPEPGEPTADGPGVDEETAVAAETSRETETTVEDTEDASEALGDWEDTDDVEPGQETVTDEEFEPEEDEVEDIGTGGAGDEMYEFDEEEREQIEEEYGTDFSTGTEVGEPGEADIDVGEPGEADIDVGEPGDEVDVEGPTEDELTDERDVVEATVDSETDQADALSETSDELPDEELAEAAEAAGGDGGEEAAETEDVEAAAEDVEATAEEDEAATDETETAADDDQAADAAGAVDVDEDADLDEAVMDAMEELDEGDGAPREQIVAAVVDSTGADPGDVDDAIEDALMGGQCYESGDDTLKPI